MDNEAFQTGTPLFRAITTGDITRVHKLLNEGGDPNECYGEDDEPALLVAAIEGRYEICSALLTAGAHADVADCEGYTPLMGAVCANSLSIVKLLLAAGASPNRTCARSGSTPLHDAAAGNHLAIARELLAAGADVNAPENQEGCTILMCAVQALAAEIVELLLQHGADPAQRSSRGDSAYEWLQNELPYIWEPVKRTRAEKILALFTT